jgi:hypothetical protein
MEIIDIRILALLNIIFFIIYFLLNIGLYLSEFLNKQITNNYNSDPHIKSGLRMHLPQIKELLKNTFIGVGAYASFLTIADYHTDKKAVKDKLDKMEADYKAANDGFNYLFKSLTTEKVYTNFNQKMG